ncbi:MAG TPA: hypothetical protein VF443_12215 [Nitrospira sp.]
MRGTRQLVIAAGLLCIVGMSHPAWAKTDEAVELRRLNPPCVTAPPPPPAPFFPDTVKTPSPGGPIPIPYPNMGGATVGPELTASSTMIVDGKPPDTIFDLMNAYVTRQIQAKRPLTVQDTILQLQRQAEAQISARTEAKNARLAAKMNSVGDDTQLVNLDCRTSCKAAADFTDDVEHLEDDARHNHGRDS